MQKKFDITGMSCSACSSKIQKNIASSPGVQNAEVNLLTNSMTVDYDEKAITDGDIINKVENLGYGASIPGKAEKREAKPDDEIKKLKTRLIASIGFLIPLMYVSMGHMVGLPLPPFLDGMGNAVSFAFIQFLLCLPVIYVNRKFFIVGFKSLFKGSPNMDSLIAVGSTAAMVYGIFEIFMMSWGLGTGNMEVVRRYHMDLYFESAAMILALITLGKFLEAKSKGRTSEAISKLMDMSPKTALIVVDGEEREIPAEELKTGDIVAVKPGMSVPADGIIRTGSTTVDESMITGESIPVEKAEGDKVTGATINKLGYIQFEATAVGDNSAFAKIIKLVEEASAKKAPISKAADKIAGIFVPVVMALAVVVFAGWLIAGFPLETALSFAICVLVISCPCALGLATPVAIMVGTGKGAENGILIKSGEALETAHKIDTVVFDKTGTITMGRPRVTDIFTDGYTEAEFLKIAYALESGSEHPLASAIVEYCREKSIEPAQGGDFASVTGLGIKGTINGRTYLGGSHKFMAENGIDVSGYSERLERLAFQGKTPVIFSDGEKAIGAAAIADTVKPTSKAAAAELMSMGVDVIMLTGDNQATAQAVAAEAGIQNVIAQVLPQDKEKVVSDLRNKGKTVAMVGDGINDAPALAAADVGMAIGAGTDVAIESADIVLMRSDLRDVPAAVRLSKAVLRNIRENLFWAFFYNVIGIPIAAGLLFLPFGFRLSPMLGALAMSLSSVCVVTNALRLKWFKARKETANEVLISEVHSLNNLTQIKEKKRMKQVKIDGMMCMHCVGSVKKALSEIGIEAEVSLEEKTARIPQEADSEAVRKAIEGAGYTVISID